MRGSGAAHKSYDLAQKLYDIDVVWGCGVDACNSYVNDWWDARYSFLYVNVLDNWQSVGREIAPNHLFNGHFQRVQRERSLLIIDNDNVDYYNVMNDAECSLRNCVLIYMR